MVKTHSGIKIDIPRCAVSRLRCLEAEIEHDDIMYLVAYTIRDSVIKIHEISACSIWHDSDYGRPLREIDIEPYQYILEYLNDTI